MDRVLLLSSAYEPLTVIPWQRAISLLTLGKVEVLETYDREVRSRYLCLKMPAVVRLVNMFRRNKQRIKFSRVNVLARDRWTCQYCGDKPSINDLTYDHVVPRSQGGKTCWENIVTACEACNAKKANKTPQQAGMRLRKQPERPKWVPILTVRFGRNAPESWKPWTGSHQ
jgi:5-methylcytosine-specific restriction endonuclease McrA